MVRLEGPSALEGCVEDHSDGTYTATYHACAAGNYTLNVTNGESALLLQHTGSQAISVTSVQTPLSLWYFWIWHANGRDHWWRLLLVILCQARPLDINSTAAIPRSFSTGVHWLQTWRSMWQDLPTRSRCCLGPPLPSAA